MSDMRCSLCVKQKMRPARAAGVDLILPSETVICCVRGPSSVSSDVRANTTASFTLNIVTIHPVRLQMWSNCKYSHTTLCNTLIICSHWNATEHVSGPRRSAGHVVHITDSLPEGSGQLVLLRITVMTTVKFSQILPAAASRRNNNDKGRR